MVRNYLRMKLYKIIIPVALMFAVAMPAAAQTVGMQSQLQILLDQLLKLQTQLVALSNNVPVDLMVSDIQIQRADSRDADPYMHTFSARVRNTGDAESYGPWLRFCVDNPNCLTNDSGHVGADPNLPPVPAGSTSATYTRSGTYEPGSHTLYVCVNTGNPPVPEYSMSNNCTSQTFEVPVIETNEPPVVGNNTVDLRPVNLARNPSGAILAGQSVTFSGSVKNDGQAASGAPWIRFCIDNEDCLTSGTGHVGVDPNIAPIAGGATSPVYARTWTATEGSHTLYFCVNTGNPPVAETTRDNNCTSISFTVGSSLAAELTPFQLSYSPVTEEITEGDTLVFYGGLRNVGGSVQREIQARFCIDNRDCGSSTAGRVGSDVTFNSIGSWTTAPLQTRTWTATEGNHTLYFCVNIGSNPVWESNTTNNCASISVSVVSQIAQPSDTPADLKPVNLGRSAVRIVDGVPTNVIIPGQTVTFLGNILNQGQGTAAQSIARFCIDNPDCLTSNEGRLGIEEGVAPIGAGRNSSIIIRTWTATAGTHTVYFCADYGNNIPESNENNNCASLTFTTGASTPTNPQNPVPPPTTTAKPDLITENFMRYPVGSITAGTMVSFSGRVANTQGVVSPASKARFCIDNANCLNSNTGRLGSDQTVSAIQPIQFSTSYVRTWTATAGTHTAYFCADVEKKVGETSESNNCTSVTFTVDAGTVPPPTAESKADLYISNLARNSVATVPVGSVLTFSAIVKNDGTKDAGSTKMRFCIDNANCLNSTTGRIGGEQNVSALDMGESSTTYTRTWTATVGTHTIYACAETGKKVSESNESNNCSSLTFTVVATTDDEREDEEEEEEENQNPGILPDLQTTGLIRLSAGTIIAGTPLTFMAYVKNLGSAAGASQARFCIDNAGCLNSTNGRLGNDHAVAALALNATSAPFAAVWTPTVGDHSVYFCADVGKVVGEFNENNNCEGFSFTVLTASEPDPEEPVAGAPDLTPITLAQIVAGDIEAGDIVGFGAYVKNNGGASIATEARFCLNNTNCLNSTTRRLGGLDEVVAPLAAGQTSPQVIRTWTAIPGEHLINFCVDVDKVATETNENNNCATLEISVPEPDEEVEEDT